MDNSTVFTRTGKGHSALQTHSPQLPRAEWFVLNMVDGHRTVDALANQLPRSIDVWLQLQQLLQDGYVQLTGTVSGIRLEAARQTTTPEPTSAPKPAPRTTSALSPAAQAIFRKELTEFMGPMAALICDDVCASAASVEEALDTFCAELRDAKKAILFRASVMKQLP